MEGDEPVEIELTPTDPRRGPGWARPSRPEGTRSDARSDPHDPTADVDPTDRSRPDDARADHAPAAATEPGGRWNDAYPPRAFTTMVAVGLVALALGWVLGRATGDDATEPASVADTTIPDADEPDAETRSDDLGATVPTVGDLATTTTDPPRRTTTTAVVAESRTIEVDPALAGAAFELVGIGWDGDLVELDLSSGDLLSRDVGTGGRGPPVVWAGDGWVVVPDWNNGTTVLVEDGEDPVPVPVGEPWQLIESETPGEFWTLEAGLQSGAAGTAQRVDRFGNSIGEPVELAEPPRFADPAGGLVVEAAGMAYRVDTDGVTKIVDGTVIALDRSRAVARTCDDHLLCGYVLVDRATGESSALQIDPRFRFDPAFWWASATTTIHPDGRTVAVTWVESSGGLALGLVDLDTGELTELVVDSDVVVRWSPDGRFALYLDGGTAMAHEIATGESFVIAAGLPRLSALDVHPGGN